MPYPVTDRILDQLSPQQRTAYERALEHQHPHLDPKVVDQLADARLFYRSIMRGPPKYLSKIRVEGEFEDGSTYTKFYVVVPRNERIRTEATTA